MTSTARSQPSRRGPGRRPSTRLSGLAPRRVPYRVRPSRDRSDDSDTWWHDEPSTGRGMRPSGRRRQCWTRPQGLERRAEEFVAQTRAGSSDLQARVGARRHRPPRLPVRSGRPTADRSRHGHRSTKMASSSSSTRSSLRSPASRSRPSPTPRPARRESCAVLGFYRLPFQTRTGSPRHHDHVSRSSGNCDRRPAGNRVVRSSPRLLLAGTGRTPKGYEPLTLDPYS